MALKVVPRKTPDYYVKQPKSEVLAKLSARRLSVTLLESQLILLRRIAMLGSDSLLRQITFETESVSLQHWDVKRKVGRPVPGNPARLPGHRAPHVPRS